MIRQTLHCHTNIDDGRDSPEAMILAAEQAGLRSVGVSLHPMFTAPSVVRGLP